MTNKSVSGKGHADQSTLVRMNFKNITRTLISTPTESFASVEPTIGAPIYVHGQSLDSGILPGS